MYPKQLTLMISLPTELYPRETGLIRWLEILSDGVIELLPLPRRTAAKPTAGQEEPQGLVKLWKLPVLGEKGGGVGAALGAGEDLAFLVTRRRFEIMAYSLPPADDDEEEQELGRRGGEGKGTKVDLEF
jgi:elongator complex protein 4